MDHPTEMQRIYEAEKRAEEYIATLPPEVVQKCGATNLMSDLVHEFLLSGSPPPSKNQIRPAPLSCLKDKSTPTVDATTSDFADIEDNPEGQRQSERCSHRSNAQIRVFHALQQFMRQGFKISSYFMSLIMVFCLIPVSVGSFFSYVYESLGATTASIILYVMVFYLPTAVWLISRPNLRPQDFLARIRVREKILFGGTLVLVTAFFQWISDSNKSFFFEQVTAGTFILVMIFIAMLPDRRHS